MLSIRARSIPRTFGFVALALASVCGSFLVRVAEAAPVCLAKGLCVDIPVDPAVFTTGKTEPFQPNVRWGGRAAAVDISSAGTMIAATDSGGVFRSETSGASWEHIEGLDAFRMRDIRFAPANPAIVLATASATSHVTNRGGIYRSVDGGRTFSRPPSQDGAPCGPLRLNGESIAWAGAQDPRVVVATNCGVAFSDDYGATWSFVGPLNTDGDPHQFYAATARVLPDRNLLIDACGGPDDGLWRSIDSGSTWMRDANLQGLGIFCGDVHTLGALPLSGSFSGADDVRLLAWTRVSDTGGCGSRGEARLAMSVNGGAWTEVPALPPIGGGACVSRPVWVRVQQQPTPGTAPQRFAYVFSNGRDAWASYCTNLPGACTAEVPPALSLDHADPNDAAFDPRTACLKLLASDAGVQATGPCTGGTFNVVGAGAGGFNALQVYEVTGTHRPDHTDLYLGTQDNDIWASSSSGSAWESAICCEGFHVQAPASSTLKDCSTFTCPSPLEGRDILVGTLCGACREFASFQHFEGCGYNPACRKNTFKRPAGGSHYPVMFDGRMFLWADSPPEYLSLTSLYMTDGAGWRVIAVLPGVEAPIAHALPMVTRRPGGGYVVYQAMRRATGKTGLLRVEWTGSGTGSVRGAEGTSPNSLDSIGERCEQFVSCDAAVAVNPFDPNHLIAADVGTGDVKVTRDGGISWVRVPAITYLATDRGRLGFSFPDPFAWWRRISQVRTIAFSPMDPGVILIGTEAAGVVASSDNGANWRKITGSERITAATSFYFLRTPRTALVSSWGRGLWQVTVPSVPPVGTGGLEDVIAPPPPPRAPADATTPIEKARNR